MLRLEHAAKRAFPFPLRGLRLEKEEARDVRQIRSLLMLHAQLTLSPHPNPSPQRARGFSVLRLEHAAKRAFPFPPRGLRLEKEEARDARQIRALLMLNAQLALLPSPQPLFPSGARSSRVPWHVESFFSLLPVGEKGRG